jgi:AraC family transcriptional regulator
MTLKTSGANIPIGGGQPPDGTLSNLQGWAAPRTGALSPELTLRISAYIEANIDQKCRTTELARLAGFSKSHFSRLFIKRFGERARQYIMHRRVAMAQTLMLAGAPLSEVALSCGMADQAHFCKQFRRVVGQSPSMWRRAIKVNAPDRVNP